MFTHIGDACRAAGFLPIAMPQCTELDRRRRLRACPSPDFCHRLLYYILSNVRNTGSCTGIAINLNHLEAAAWPV